MIKFLVMDVDGTLTDGKIYMGQNGEAFKSFDVKDGFGIKDILQEINISPIIITARYSDILIRRCEELGIKYVFQGERDKLKKLNQFIIEKSKVDNYRYELSEIAYIGDDILDLQCMLPIKNNGGIVGCPKDAVKEVTKIATFISSRNGGDGAVREFIEYLRIINNKKTNIKI